MRRYGHEPFTVAVVHGGPGAPGEMAEVAEELSSVSGVLEPLQTAASVAGQAEELREVLEENGELPVILIGFSWGAWLSTILAAQNPHCVSKLVLVSSGPFETGGAAAIMKTRLDRLALRERAEAEVLMARIFERSARQDSDLGRFGELMSRADAYAPLAERVNPLPANPEIHDRVWSEASEMRDRGELLGLASQVACPVVAIHGDYDPHPAASISFLANVFREFRFVLLDKCGHYPWRERYARDAFFELIRAEVGAPDAA